MSELSDGRRRRSATRVPPHNLDAEASLLGALLLSKDALTAVAETGINAADFYKPAHQHVYEAVRVLASAGEPVDAVTVAEELRRNSLLDEIGGPTNLLDLQAATPGHLQRRPLRPHRAGHRPAAATDRRRLRHRRTGLRRARRRGQGPGRGRDKGVRDRRTSGK